MTTPPDLLVAGDERPSRRRSRRRRRLVAAVVVAVLLGVLGGQLVRQDRADDARRQQRAAEADVVSLALPPGRTIGPRYPPQRAGVHLLLANEGPSAVRLLEATLLPAAWQVQLPLRTVVPSGGSVVLELAPPVGCGAPGPRELRLAVRSRSGRTSVVQLAVGGIQMAYGGDLDAAVALAEQSCDPSAPPTDGRTSPSRS